MRGRHSTVHVSGPIVPLDGNVYRVQYGQGVTSNAASLRLCMAVAADYNKRHGKTLASVEYIGPQKKRLSEGQKT